ncbi:MAG: ABC transporter ATP-binding protein [Oscillospiraceae bacterium]|nr:ABC transporter ATP-binding protein [Oscillospiraceae bacterium]
MLELKDIRKIYRLDGREIAALDGIDLKIEDGEFVAIIGASGSGKSTLLNILGCLDSASGGEYLIDGKRVSSLSDKALGRVRGKKIGFVFQNFSLVPTLTAYENVELPLIYRGISAAQRKEAAMNALEAVGMLSRKSHLPSQLSGGQMQRVAVARAVAGSPSVILADEPTGNLDRKNSDEVMFLLKEFNRLGRSVVLVTHDMTVAKKADRIIKITNGKIDYTN